jgi:hypothetical protein
MSVARSVLEAPVTPLLQARVADAADRHDEPILTADQIQGNILPGFSKDFQTLLFLNIDDPSAFAGWFGRMVPRIATLEFVLSFNRLFQGHPQTAGRRNRHDPGNMDQHCVFVRWPQET